MVFVLSRELADFGLSDGGGGIHDADLIALH